MAILLITILVAAALIGLWLIQGYNQLIHAHAVVKEAWSGIDVQLQRRYDLIPNLVKTVKQYSIHEKDVLENVTKMRSSSMQADSVDQKAEYEAQLTSALKTLFAVAENYPDLKANENFMQLQNQLSQLEDEVQLARRYYNGAARNYNIIVQSFPSHLIASLFGFTQESYFTLSRDEEREAPDIQF